MVIATVWAVMTFLALGGVLGAVRGLERATGIVGEPSRRLGIMLAGGSALGLVVIGVLYQVQAVSKLDGRFVEQLADARSDALVSALRVVTTLGDVVPSYTLAAVLAIWLIQQRGSGLWPLLLPALLLLELALQFGYNKIFPVDTLEVVLPDVPIDGAGSIPSGSVARLLTIFVVACLIYRRSRPAGDGRWLTTVGATLVLVEIVTRVYLGRHFVSDIAGGLLLGILLSLLGAFLLSLARPVSRRSV